MADELISREKAIELINGLCVDSNENWIGNDNQSFILHADVVDILADVPSVNAVVLPCKVGDTVWFIGTECDKWDCWDYGDHCHIGCKKWKTPKIRETTIRQFRLFGDHFDSMTDTTALADSSSNHFHLRDIGKTVFLTREEAEKALEGREDNG